MQWILVLLFFLLRIYTVQTFDQIKRTIQRNHWKLCRYDIYTRVCKFLSTTVWLGSVVNCWTWALYWSTSCLSCVLCPVAAAVVEENKPTNVDFLGLSVDEAAAVAGQWVLLVLGIVLLVSTAFVGYKYNKSRRLHKKSISQMELK